MVPLLCARGGGRGVRRTRIASLRMRESGVVDPGTAALAAAIVALTVGLFGLVASLVQSSRTARATITAELNARQVDALVTVMRNVEAQGLAIQDLIFNLTQAEFGGQYEEYEPGPEKRDVNEPPRTNYAEASALVAAYGTAPIQKAFSRWTNAVDEWDTKRAGLASDWSQGDRERTQPGQVLKEKTEEAEARTELGAAVNLNLRSLRKL
jgi:hypothetical protein